MIWYDKKERAGWDTYVHMGRVASSLGCVRSVRAIDDVWVWFAAHRLKSGAPNQTAGGDSPRRSRWKTLFHLRPLAYGEIVIFTTTSGSLPKNPLFFAPTCDPRSHDQKISNFCVGSDGNIRAENVSHPTREGCDGYVACKLTLSQVEKEQDNSLRTHGGHVYSLPFDPPFLPPSWSSNFSSQPCPFSLLFINWSPLKGFL